ncbi:ABC-type transport auxiliary lipoprotein family protein [Novosphingobium sp. 9]|uniref:ABC-type transport auxiliary lipoprotein family protein n=1 Tax=Novosphingobium sp. 9 TaxID=2025349 RepID=UPI0021B579D0|nr:ABC-type transport auxiliary lipoprotein family protein [Novosphingobium sp. 9]
MNAISLSRMARLTQGLLLSGAACAALSGCISLAPKVPNQLLSLTPAHSAPSGDLASASLKDALVITEPDADRSLDVMRVPVRVDNSSIAYLKDASWMEKPTREFRDLLAETIRANSGKLVVVDSDFEEPGQTVLSGRLLDMGYVAATHTVVVRFDAILNQPGAKVVTRRFEASVPNVEAKAAAVGPALNTAANQVAQQVADWMKTQG